MTKKAAKDTTKDTTDATEKEQPLIQCPYCNVGPMPEDTLKAHTFDMHWDQIMAIPQKIVVALAEGEAEVTKLRSELAELQAAAPGPAPGPTPREEIEVTTEARLANVEAGLAKVVEYITGQPRAAPDQAQPGEQQKPPGAITGNPLIDLGIQKALGMGPPEDPFAEIGKMYVKEGLKASIAGQKSYYSRLGRALGEDAIKEAEGAVERIFGETHVTGKPKSPE